MIYQLIVTIISIVLTLASSASSMYLEPFSTQQSKNDDRNTEHLKLNYDPDFDVLKYVKNKKESFYFINTDNFNEVFAEIPKANQQKTLWFVSFLDPHMDNFWQVSEVVKGVAPMNPEEISNVIALFLKYLQKYTAKTTSYGKIISALGNIPVDRRRQVIMRYIPLKEYQDRWEDDDYVIKAIAAIPGDQISDVMSNSRKLFREVGGTWRCGDTIKIVAEIEPSRRKFVLEKSIPALKANLCALTRRNIIQLVAELPQDQADASIIDDIGALAPYLHVFFFDMVINTMRTMPTGKVAWLSKLSTTMRGVKLYEWKTIEVVLKSYVVQDAKQ